MQDILEASRCHMEACGPVALYPYLWDPSELYIGIHERNCLWCSKSPLSTSHREGLSYCYRESAVLRDRSVANTMAYLGAADTQLLCE